MGVRITAGLAEHAVRVEVLVNVEQAGLTALEGLPKLAQGQPPKGGIEAFVLLDAPAGHEPEALRRTVEALAEEDFPLRALHHQIDGHQRRGCHHVAKGCVSQPHDSP
ncbi:hypothetical protein D9M71_708340 [compost metagenome]